jgi:thiol-disulfide isomerase/thioredoxin
MSFNTVFGGGHWTCSTCGKTIYGTSIHHQCGKPFIYIEDRTSKNNNYMKEYFERNPESKPYLDRFVKEWKQHGKVIIGVDFDNTISPYFTFDNSEDIKRTIDILKLAKSVGAYIVIFTACDKDRYDYIKNYCKEIGLEIDAINQNPIELPYGNNGKIYANLFIDDRAGLNESLAILEFASYIIRGSKNGSENFDV